LNPISGLLLFKWFRLCKPRSLQGTRENKSKKIGKNGAEQGCQMVCFQTKNTNLGKFWRVLQWKFLVYFMVICTILRPFGVFYGYLVYFSPFWYVVPRKIWQPWSRTRIQFKATRVTRLGEVSPIGLLLTLGSLLK
jgi:hypothetical protein